MLFDITLHKTLHNKNNTIIWKYATNDNTITNENGVLLNLDFITIYLKDKNYYSILLLILQNIHILYNY